MSHVDPVTCPNEPWPRCLRRSVFLLILALTWRAVFPGQVSAQIGASVVPAAQQAGQAATLARVTALRDAFIQHIHSAGYTCPIPAPTIVMEDVPSFGNYEDSTNTLHTSDWSKLSSDERSLFFRLAGPGADENAARASFEEGTHRWVFVHELGHWWQACEHASEGRSHYEVEFGANRIALAYWRETDPAFAEKMVGIFKGLLDNVPNPVPPDHSVVQYFDANYESLGPTPAYRWFQARMIVTARQENPLPTFAQSLVLSGK